MAAGDLIAQAHACGDASEFRDLAVRWLAARVGADSGIFVRLSQGRIAGAALFNKEQFRHLLPQMNTQRDRYRPFLQRSNEVMVRGRGGYVDNDAFSRREMERSPFYVDIVRPQKITSQIALAVSFHGRVGGAVYLCRHGRGRGFGERELRKLLPVLQTLAVAHTAAESIRPRAPVIDDRFAGLSPRQLAVARWVAGGLTNPEIAIVLGCSVFTVRNHLVAVFQTLGVRSRAQVAVWAEAALGLATAE